MPSYTKAALFIFMASYHVAIAAPIADSTNNNQVDNAFSGTAGYAPGGSVHITDDGKGLSKGLVGGLKLVKLFSDNAGNAGHAISGSASAPSSGRLEVGLPNAKTKIGQHDTNMVGEEYTGAGGISEGGNVDGDGGIIELFSNNAGAGGDANSGSAGPSVLLNKKINPMGMTKVSRVIHIRLD